MLSKGCQVFVKLITEDQKLTLAEHVSVGSFVYVHQLTQLSYLISVTLW